MQESLVAFGELLISDEELSESIEPGMSRFHDPTSVPRRTSTSALLSCDPWSIATEANLLTDRLTIVPLIRIQEPTPLREGDDDCIEHCGELSDIMSMGPGNDQPQRDAMSVHEEVSLASLFSPGLSGSDRSLPEPEGL